MMYRMNYPFPYFVPIEAISNEANERCKPLRVTVYPVPRFYVLGSSLPTPPCVRSFVVVRPLPIFF